MELNLNVEGRVQGVAFRRLVRRFARECGLSGYVENRTDGSVFIRAQGEKELLDALLAWVHSSPGASRVEKAHASWKSVSSTFSDFSIRVHAPFLEDQKNSFYHLFNHLWRGRNE